MNSDNQVKLVLVTVLIIGIFTVAKVVATGVLIFLAFGVLIHRVPRLRRFAEKYYKTTDALIFIASLYTVPGTGFNKIAPVAVVGILTTLYLSFLHTQYLKREQTLKQQQQELDDEFSLIIDAEFSTM